MTLPYNTYS